jgi:hypothetical protein
MRKLQHIFTFSLIAGLLLTSGSILRHYTQSNEKAYASLLCEAYVESRDEQKGLNLHTFEAIEEETNTYLNEQGVKVQRLSFQAMIEINAVDSLLSKVSCNQNNKALLDAINTRLEIYYNIHREIIDRTFLKRPYGMPTVQQILGKSEALKVAYCTNEDTDQMLFDLRMLKFRCLLQLLNSVLLEHYYAEIHGISCFPFYGFSPNIAFYRASYCLGDTMHYKYVLTDDGRSVARSYTLTMNGQSLKVKSGAAQLYLQNLKAGVYPLHFEATCNHGLYNQHHAVLDYTLEIAE